MSLGIGGATPFAQGSNHQTAANHQIRDTSSYDHTKQTKIKCSSCGMWATKGSSCTFCKMPAKGTSAAGSPKASLKPAAPEKTTVSNNALTHQHRDVKAFDHTKQTKIKCSSCGCWMKKGAPACSVCKRPSK